VAVTGDDLLRGCIARTGRFSLHIGTTHHCTAVVVKYNTIIPTTILLYICVYIVGRQNQILQ